MRIKPRTFIAGQAVRLAEHWLGRKLLPIDYPPLRSRPRYGYGRPPHARLLVRLGEGEEAYRQNLETFLAFVEDIARIPAGPATEGGPVWRNAWLPPLDAVTLYGFLRSRRPRSYVEVGSGVSTRFARRAIEDGALPTRITSVDPNPREEVDALCDRVVRAPLEAIDLALFDELEPGDIVFMDGSHRVLTGSDATVFFLDVLPALPAGVLVAVHDVLLPDDYPPEWTDWHWSEQYLLGAWLLANGNQVRLELAAHYVSAHSQLHRLLDPVWRSPALAGVPTTGVALWLSTTNR